MTKSKQTPRSKKELIDFAEDALHSCPSISGLELQDITGAEVVEIIVRKDGAVVWVSVDGICRMLISRISKRVVVEDQRPVTLRDAADFARDRDYYSECLEGWKASVLIRDALASFPARKKFIAELRKRGWKNEEIEKLIKEHGPRSESK